RLRVGGGSATFPNPPASGTIDDDSPGEWRNWQTRRIQVPVIARSWGFKSPLAHPEPPPGRSAVPVAVPLATVCTLRRLDFRNSLPPPPASGGKAHPPAPGGGSGCSRDRHHGSRSRDPGTDRLPGPSQ